MAKYKKKKVIDSQVDLKKDSPQSTTNMTHASFDASAPDQKRLKKLAMGSLKLQFAGDLVLVKNPQKVSSGLFKRYTELFEAIAN
ncbi:MAG: hypothetical protein NT027_00560, partial [Proteobacteria bacterium]|nr:hypothetical protein [Pseudomonadota bacterium]